MAKPILEIRNISKQYRLGGQKQPYLSLRDQIVDKVKNLKALIRPSSYEEDKFWALQGVSFDVHPGESLGIIGRNGAGKSTLLKILSKITPPTKGHIRSRGRVASLLEVGTGFHQELTGRENIYLNGSILGLKRAEINKKFDEIVDFSGVERFLDTQLKHYSSGMQLRLAFAVAAHLEPEILVIDEVLAVGDATFQKKCLGKMDEVSKSGRTILFVSHNMGAVRSLCSKVVWLHDGKIQEIGNSNETINNYLGLSTSNNTPFKIDKEEISNKAYGHIKRNSFIDIHTIYCTDSSNRGKVEFLSTEKIILHFEFEILSKPRKFFLVVSILGPNEEPILISQLGDSECHDGDMEPGHYHIKCEIPANLLASRTYSLSVEFINLRSEHYRLFSILNFKVHYNNPRHTYGAFDNTLFRPNFYWNKEKITAISKQV